MCRGPAHTCHFTLTGNSWRPFSIGPSAFNVFFSKVRILFPASEFVVVCQINKGDNMRKFILIWFVVLLPALVHAEPELKGTPVELLNYLSSLPNEVTLIGEAKIEIQAESGIVTIGIKTEDPQLQNSLQKNQKLRKEITSKLITSGISQDKIKGTKFSSTPEYGFFGKKPNNYVVENVLTITVENEKELQEVAGIVDSYKEAFYQGIELKEKEKKEIKNQLLNMALSNAKVRQKVYETDLGIILKPISFEENISTEKTQFEQKRLEKRKISYNSASREGVYSDDLSLGEHIYHGSVIIKYQVISK